MSKKGLIPVLAAGVLGLATVSASATDGYFSYAYGARAKGVGGAGVADSVDATGQIINPAGLVRSDHEIDVSLTMFAPFREYNGGAADVGFAASGINESGMNFFAIPNIAYAKPLDDTSSIGFIMIGNGGMNTDYQNPTRTSQFCDMDGAPPNGPAWFPGSFCAGQLGVDLMQVLMGITYAKKMGKFSFGVTPIFALQRMEVKGLGAFAGLSSNPAALTNMGHDYSYGGGVRAGAEFAVSDRLRVAGAVQSPMWMTEFDKYAGLFAEQGDFDIPWNFTVGAAFDVMPNLTIMADYKRIFYSTVNSISNPSTQHNTLGCAGGVGAGCFGQPGGTGFGWEDINIVKVGAEWDVNEKLTLRAGYSYNENPIPSRDVMFNILAPGVVQHHITGGLALQMTHNTTLEFAAAYVPEETVSGFEIAPGSPAHAVSISMHQFEVTGGIKFKFGAEEYEPLK